MKILATLTFREKNRKLSMAFKKRSEKKGRGAWDYRTDQNSGTHLEKQYGNECVLIRFTHAGKQNSKN